MKSLLKRSLLLLQVLMMYPQAFSQNIYLTGDSHVSGKVYPAEVKKIIEDAKPTATVNYWGKGGAGFYTFNETPAYMDSIYKAKPDILIVHLGTNGCYNVPLDPVKTRADIGTFYMAVRDSLPDSKIVFVTPFYNKNRDVIATNGDEKVFGPWKLNEKTRGVSDIIVEFANGCQNTFVIDNNADAGTVFFDRPGLIREDNIHLTAEGYELLGRLVAGKLLEIEQLWQK